MKSRGYFEIGVFHPKTEVNIGTLWRSAQQLGAAGIFTIGRRYRRQASDTTNAALHVPLRHYESFDEFLENRPDGALLIAIEQGGRHLFQYGHPVRAVYLLGAEDYGLPKAVTDKCNSILSLESVGHNSYNVAVAGSIVMYHRQFMQKAGL